MKNYIQGKIPVIRGMRYLLLNQAHTFLFPIIWKLKYIHAQYYTYPSVEQEGPVIERSGEKIVRVSWTIGRGGVREWPGHRGREA